MATEPRKPVKYLVLEKSLIGNEIFEPGALVDYDGLPAENLAPQCDEGHARYQEYLESNRQRVALMKAQNADSSVGDPEAFAKAVATAIAEANAGIEERVAAAVTQAMAAIQAAQAPKGKAKDSLV